MLKTITRFLQKREITRDNGEKYLTRYCIFGFMPKKKRFFPISLYLHHFHAPDKDEHPHNHPWKWSLSFVLKGGYIEYRTWKEPWRDYKDFWWTRISVIKPFTFNWISHGIYHKVEELRGKETWTLFLAGPRVSSWGFLDDNYDHIDWRTYLTKPEY